MIKSFFIISFISISFLSCVQKTTSVALSSARGTIDFYNKDLNQHSTCPINFNHRTFNMVEFGGSANQRFTSNEEIEAFVEQATQKEWDFDSNNCSLSSLHTYSREVPVNLPMCKVCNIDFDDPGRTLQFNEATATPNKFIAINNGGLIPGSSDVTRTKGDLNPGDESTPLVDHTQENIRALANYSSSIYNSENELVAEYGVGNFYSLSEHYSLGETLPLLPGTYSVKTKNEYCQCNNELVIEPYDICTNFLNQAYNGPTQGPGANPTYKIPVSSSMSSIDLYWSTQFTPDKVLISYNGKLINGDSSFDSSKFTSTGTSSIQESIPFTYVPGVDEMSIQVIPDASAGDDTIWTFGLGCCPDRTCDAPIPKRDLIIEEVIVGDNGSFSFKASAPYTSRRVRYLEGSGTFMISNTNFLENSFTQSVSDPNFLGCVSPDVNLGQTTAPSWIYQYSHTHFYHNPGACRQVGLQVENSCIDVANDANKITSYESTSGSKIVHWDFSSLVFYNDFKTRMNNLVSPFLDDDVLRADWFFQQGQCGSDQPMKHQQIYNFKKSFLSFDDANKRMILDFSTYIQPTDSLGECGFHSGLNHALRWVQLGDEMESNTKLAIWKMERHGFHRKKVTTRLKTSCGEDFVQPYYLHILDPANPAGSWEFYRGSDELSGVKIQDYSTFNSEISSNGSLRSRKSNKLPIQNIHGFNIDCHDVNFSKEFDLTPVHSSATKKNFIDGNDLTSYLSTQTGDSWKWHEQLCMPYNTSGGYQYDGDSLHPIQK